MLGYRDRQHIFWCLQMKNKVEPCLLFVKIKAIVKSFFSFDRLQNAMQRFLCFGWGLSPLVILFFFFFFKKWAIPGLFFLYFRLFNTVWHYWSFDPFDLHRSNNCLIVHSKIFLLILALLLLLLIAIQSYKWQKCYYYYSTFTKKFCRYQNKAHFEPRVPLESLITIAVFISG